MNNQELFEECLKHSEPLIDPYYCTDRLIISEQSTSPPTPLMQTNEAIINRITAIMVAMEDHADDDVINGHIEKLSDLLKEDGVNFTEFTSFFPTLDVSYSVYKSLSQDEKLDFLKIVAVEYIKKRHKIYQSHGYSPIILQVRKDFEKHKTGGNAANVKYSTLLNEKDYKAADTAQEMLTRSTSFVSIDNGRVAEPVLDHLKHHYGLKFEWQLSHQDKSADMIVKINNRYFISEFKHMKEGGGGQDKQVAELISFIKYSESHPDLSYLSLLDGIYFNSFVNPRGKKKTQLMQIREYLSENPNNYFVNTWGFEQLTTN